MHKTMSAFKIIIIAILFISAFSPMNAQEEEISKLWEWFSKNEAVFSLKDASKDPQSSTEAFTRNFELKLKSIDQSLTFDLIINDKNKALIISADGDPKSATTVISIVSSAPQINGWSIRAFRPQNILDEGFKYKDEIINIDTTSGLLFNSDDGKLGLLILVDTKTINNWSDYCKGIHKALTHILGERILIYNVNEIIIKSKDHDLYKKFKFETVSLKSFYWAYKILIDDINNIYRE
jgi:hypothetical protein